MFFIIYWLLTICLFRLKAEWWINFYISVRLESWRHFSVIYLAYRFCLLKNYETNGLRQDTYQRTSQCSRTHATQQKLTSPWGFGGTAILRWRQNRRFVVDRIRQPGAVSRWHSLQNVRVKFNFMCCVNACERTQTLIIRGLEELPPGGGAGIGEFDIARIKL